MTRSERQIRIRLAVLFAVLGASALTILASTSTFPPLGTWAFFTAAFVFLEWRSVEVNDRLRLSSTVMVALTGGFVFAAAGASAALGMAAMAALGPLIPEDLKERRWFQPAVNFGQLTVSAGASGLLIDWLLPKLAPLPIQVADFPTVALVGGAAAVVYAVLNFGQVRTIVRLAFGRRDIRPWSGMGTLVPSYLVMGLLGGLLGATYEVVGPEVLPLMLGVFVVTHLTFVSYSELREAHEATLRGFVKALEAKDLYTRGHTERVAYFAQLIAQELGYSGTQIERLRWAALIHDVGKLAVPRHLIRKKGQLSPAEYQELQAHAHHVEDLLAEVEFLKPMVEIASGHHSHYDGSGYGGTGHNHGSKPSEETCIVAVADAFDAMTSTRSYRLALSQEFAFGELRKNSGTQFDPRIVEALHHALRRTGETFGHPARRDEEEARRFAEQSGRSHG